MTDTFDFSKPPKFICCSGNGRCGKDLFADLLIKNVGSNKIVKLSLAEQLKRDCAPFLKDVCGVDDPFEPKNKSEIRPLWIWFGGFKREQTNGKYFLESLQKRVDFFDNSGLYTTFIIPDVRLENEYEYFKDRNSVFVFIDKYKFENDQITYTPPASKEEAYNNPILRQSADVKVKWLDCGGDTTKIEKFCVPEVHKFIAWLENRR